MRDRIAGSQMALIAICSFIFAPGASGAQCPNEAIRADQGAQVLALPSCMALEMVSPAQKASKPAKEEMVSANGDAVVFKTTAQLAGSPGVVSVAGDPYVATYTTTGWTVAPTVAPAGFIHGWGLSGDALSFSPDFSSWLQVTATMPQYEVGLSQAYQGGLDDPFAPLSPLLAPLAAGREETVGDTTLRGAAADRSHLYFSPGVERDPAGNGNGFGSAYLPGDPEPNPVKSTADSNVYVAQLDSGGAPSLELLARDRLGKAWGGTCGARLGGLTGEFATISGTNQGAIAADGSRVFLSAREGQPASGACNTANKLRILERRESPSGPVIGPVFTSECNRPATPTPCSTADGDDLYQGASVDQSKLYFTTTRQLANTDTDATSDLYLYDSSRPAGERLVQVSAGEVTPTHPVAGAGAAVSAATAISGDGSRAYFTSSAVLTTATNPAGEEALPGQPNLYLYDAESGTLAFIGSVGAGAVEGSYPVPLTGSEEGAAVGGDGHILFFFSKAKLTAQDADASYRDLYRYEAGAPATLLCVSCAGTDSGAFDVEKRPGPSEARPGGPAGVGTDFAEQGRWASEDGETAVFKSAEGLIGEDTNNATDSYLWREGKLALLPGTSDPSGGLKDTPVLSHDGSTVAFTSFQELLPADGDATTDVYVARAGGGYPTAAVAEPCELEAGAGQECQRRGEAPAAPSPAASESSPEGNLSQPPTQLCKKGFVRRQGRCVKKPHHRKKHHTHRKSSKRHATADRRAAK